MSSKPASGSLTGDDTLSNALDEILHTYGETRETKAFGKTNDDGQKRRIWKLFEEIKELLEESSVVSQRPNVRVKWSVGQGNWARVPWIAFLDERETSTTRKGVYVVYLFRQDLSGVYLTYNQGVTQPKDDYSRDVAYAILENRAERLRRRANRLGEDGFSLDRHIDLASDRGLGQDYEVSTIAYKLYQPNAIPGDNALLEDLDATLQVYDQYVSRRRNRPQVHIDRNRLREATQNVIRPAVHERGDLNESGRHGAIHHEAIPGSTPALTPSGLESTPRQSIVEAMALASTMLPVDTHFQRAASALQSMDVESIQQETTELLYGTDKMGERTRQFAEWLADGLSEAGVEPEDLLPVGSYLLALSDPQGFPFLDGKGTYAAAAEALLTDEDIPQTGSERVAHARSFYQTALQVFKEDHEDLPFQDLFHVYVAFAIAAEGIGGQGWGQEVLSSSEEPAAEEGRERIAVKIAPGRGAKYWDDCRENGYIRVGWDDVGDLRQYDQKGEFEDAFHEAYLGDTYGSAKTTQKGTELWTLHQLQPGDLVVANRGKSEVLAVGTVIEPGYEWRPELREFSHTVNVNWDTSYAQEIPEQSYWGMVTVREIDDDLLERILNREWSEQRQAYESPPLEKIYDSVQQNGMTIDRRTLRRYHVSLQTRGFVILSGVSGTGKTWLTRLYADAVRAERLLVPVAPNWTSNEDLLGYYNPVEDEYHHTKVSRFLQQAETAYEKAVSEGRSPRPYHLVLDEMNLARVEYYFAKFLSAMEERQRGNEATLTLHPETSETAALEVDLPPNLSFIGTVNIDETTHAFADKVYDRAQLIEMQAPEERLRKHAGDAPYADLLLDVWKDIGGVSPFAFRVLDEVAEYVDIATDHGAPWEEALDEQLLQKVLPKLKGTEPAVGDALQGLLETIDEETYPLTYRKAQAMKQRYERQGFTSYFS